MHRAGQAHRELLDACKTKNPEIAEKELWKHITEAGEYLKEFIKRHREQHP
jgi:DNA-binding FadR family transcriptional regulator